MGFMDKAKQLAEQAQQKLEETQKQFNESQAQKAAGGGQPANVRYDEHGQPIEDQPAPAEAAAEEPVAEASAPPKPTPEGVDTNPDPFKPIQ